MLHSFSRGKKTCISVYVFSDCMCVCVCTNKNHSMTGVTQAFSGVKWYLSWGLSTIQLVAIKMTEVGKKPKNKKKIQFSVLYFWWFPFREVSACEAETGSLRRRGGHLWADQGVVTADFPRCLHIEDVKKRCASLSGYQEAHGLVLK